MKVFSVLAAAALLPFPGASNLQAGTGRAVTVLTGRPAVTARATAAGGDVRVSGSVNRTLGLGQSGGSVSVCVYSPEGRMVSCTTTRVTYPNRRPLARSRVGSYSITVQATAGSTIRVGGCPQC